MCNLLMVRSDVFDIFFDARGSTGFFVQVSMVLRPPPLVVPMNPGQKPVSCTLPPVNDHGSGKLSICRSIFLRKPGGFPHLTRVHVAILWMLTMAAVAAGSIDTIPT